MAGRSLEDALAAELDAQGIGEEEAGELGVVEGTVEELAPLFGGDRATQNSRMAMLLSGTSDKGTRAYRSAIRSIQRYRAPEGRQTRTPRAPRLALLVAGGAARRQPRSVDVSVAGDVQVSTDRRYRHIATPLPEGATQRMLDAHAAGDRAGAASALLDGIRDTYAPVASIENVDELTITPEPRL